MAREKDGYRENLELFEHCGVKIRTFSPLHDAYLPAHTNGILLGGGYPENYLEQLSGNTSMLVSIRDAIERGIPSLAECGGFMYLHRMVKAPDGTPYPMVGVIDGECYYAGHLVRFGYMMIDRVRKPFDSDPLAKSLAGMRGHEFHYYESTAGADACIAVKPDRNRSWDCIIAKNNGIWGFPHLYYRSAPSFVPAFIAKMNHGDGVRGSFPASSYAP